MYQTSLLSPAQVSDILSEHGIFCTIETICWLRANDVFISPNGYSMTSDSVYQYIKTHKSI